MNLFLFPYMSVSSSQIHLFHPMTFFFHVSPNIYLLSHSLFFFAQLRSHIHQLQHSVSIRPRVKSRSNIQALKRKITSSESWRYFQLFRKAVCHLQKKKT